MEVAQVASFLTSALKVGITPDSNACPSIEAKGDLVSPVVAHVLPNVDKREAPEPPSSGPCPHTPHLLQIQACHITMNLTKHKSKSSKFRQVTT